MFALVTSHPAMSALLLLAGPGFVAMVLPYRAKVLVSSLFGGIGPILVFLIGFLVLGYAFTGIQHDPDAIQVDTCTNSTGWALCHVQ